MSDKLGNANYYVLRTLFNLPKCISYDQILLQYNLDSIKHRRLVQALTLVYKGIPIIYVICLESKNVLTIFVVMVADSISRTLIPVLNTDLSITI